MSSLHLRHELKRRGVRFMVGRDSAGRWVVSDRDGLVGGIFSDQASAVHFAMFESDHMPGAVCCVQEEISLGDALSPAEVPGGSRHLTRSHGAGRG